jgi:hypothetical protein
MSLIPPKVAGCPQVGEGVLESQACLSLPHSRPQFPHCKSLGAVFQAVQSMITAAMFTWALTQEARAMATVHDAGSDTPWEVTAPLLPKTGAFHCPLLRAQHGRPAEFPWMCSPGVQRARSQGVGRDPAGKSPVWEQQGAASPCPDPSTQPRHTDSWVPKMDKGFRVDNPFRMPLPPVHSQSHTHA